MGKSSPLRLDDLDDVLTVPVVARFFKVCPKVVYDKIRLGEIPAYRFGRKRGGIRISKRVVEKLLEEGRLQIEANPESSGGCSGWRPGIRGR